MALQTRDRLVWRGEKNLPVSENSDMWQRFRRIWEKEGKNGIAFCSRILYLLFFISCHVYACAQLTTLLTEVFFNDDRYINLQTVAKEDGFVAKSTWNIPSSSDSGIIFYPFHSLYIKMPHNDFRSTEMLDPRNQYRSL